MTDVHIVYVLDFISAAISIKNPCSQSQNVAEAFAVDAQPPRIFVRFDA